MDLNLLIAVGALIIAAVSLLLNLRVFVTPVDLNQELKNIYDRLEGYQPKDSCNSRHSSLDANICEILRRLEQITDCLLKQSQGGQK